MKTTNPLRKIADSRLFWMAVALIISFGIWGYVTGMNTDETKRTFSGVVVEFAGQDTLSSSKNLVITDVDTNTVTVEISGPKRIVNRLSASDLCAQIDVSRLVNSAYTSLSYSILFPDGIDTSNITVNNKTPDTINFMVSRLTSKAIQVTGSFDGSVADGYTGQTPQFEPSVITVTGPEAYIKDISYAYVTFGAENVSKTYSVETVFALKNSAGEECDRTGITLSDETVTATMTVDEIKNMPLTVNLIYGAGADENNVKVSVEPEYITLSGDSAILDTYKSISLATIDLTEFDSSYVASYPIVIDEGLNNRNGVFEATVRIEITGLTTKKFTVAKENISCVNVTDGYSAEVITESVEVILRGEPGELEKIKPENIRVVADLNEYNTSVGSYMPPCRVYVDGEQNVGAIKDYVISIILRKAE